MVARKWRHLFYSAQPDSLLQAWYHLVQHQKLSRELRRTCQNKTKEKLLSATQQATAAARRRDSRGLYEAIRALAPKQTDG